MDVGGLIIWLHTVWLAIIVDINYAFSRPSTMLTEIYKTDKGRVRGIRQTVHRKQVDVFLGIPFAEPPVGRYRFRLPIPKDPWTHVWNATVKPSACMQGYDGQFGNFSGAWVWNPNTTPSEDCLYLNVWTPVTPTKNKAVFVWIYGGGFYSGSAVLDIYDGKYIAALNDIIVVSMQYRVGSLGYLAMGHTEAPGNAGMYDQAAALDWIQTNIHEFGGSHMNVTIVGESAGAVSVGMHLVSPRTRGLFNRAILQSGAPHAAWATYSKEEALRRGRVLAKHLDCGYEDVGRAIRCLKKVPAESFPMADFSSEITVGIIQFPFVPIVDGRFLIEEPEVSLMRGNFKKTEILIGSNKNEGNYFLIYAEPKVFPMTNSCLLSHERFNLTMDTLFTHFPRFPEIINNFGKEAIIFQYTNWKDTSDQEMNRIMIDQSIGDFHFTCPGIDLAERYAAAGQDVYYYYFEHRSSIHVWPQWTGVMHADEINFVFGEPLMPGSRYTQHEKKLSKQIMGYWTNFAKTGNPNRAPGKLGVKEWPKHTTSGKEFLRLKDKYLHDPDKHNAIGSGHRVKECAFWRYYLPKLIASTDNWDQEPENCTSSGIQMSATASPYSMAFGIAMEFLFTVVYSRA
ncbi:hypothetical protein ScPMuIL_018824 [Solemya velum]